MAPSPVIVGFTTSELSMERGRAEDTCISCDETRWIQWFNLMYQYEDLDCSCWPDLLMKAGFLEAIDRGRMVFLSGLTER